MSSLLAFTGQSQDDFNRPLHEVCKGCAHCINIGQATTECQKCGIIIHTKCYKKTKFSLINRLHYCFNCQASIVQRYNPFTEMDTDNSDKDNFYEQSLTSSVGVLTTASKVLEQCKEFNISELKNIKSGGYSSLFYNIGGNSTNFDKFVTEIKCIDHSFSVIGLAETNIDQMHSDLYKIDNYQCFYSPKLEGKKIGTGVALYVNDSFKVTILDHLCTTNSNIETLFAKLVQNEKEVIVGVVYRSPNCNFSEFLVTYKTITDQLPSKKFVQILGDFNVNLFKTNETMTSQFEEHFLSEGLYPTISIQTHKRDLTKGSCIDNIYTTSIENIQYSGTIQGFGKHHSLIFTTSNLNMEQKVTCEKQKISYDFSNLKMDKFLVDLTEMSEESMGINDPSDLNFEKFVKSFSTEIDKAFKLEVPKFTKRTYRNNPWITEGIIQGVLHKAKLYVDWKRTCSEKLVNGNQELYNKYSTYRKCLKSVISQAKKKFYNKKILDNTNDHKKTWEVINQLRGKAKRTIKPSFVINNVRINERRAIAQEFNKYFVSIASNMNKSIDELGVISMAPLQSFQDFMPRSIPNSIFLNECSTFEITQIINELENGKSSDIPIKVIKRANSIISPILSLHFNYLMKIGKFPDMLNSIWNRG